LHPQDYKKNHRVGGIAPLPEKKILAILPGIVPKVTILYTKSTFFRLKSGVCASSQKLFSLLENNFNRFMRGHFFCGSTKKMKMNRKIKMA
jgi:hypothetical protein